jgi:hypothetical protein
MPFFFPTLLIPFISSFFDATLLLHQMTAEIFSICLTAGMEQDTMWLMQERKDIEEANKLITKSHR